MELGGLAARPVEPDVAFAVAQRVVDKVREGLLEPDAVALDAQTSRRLRVKAPASVGRAPREAGEYRLEERVEFELLDAKREAAPV